MLCIAFVIMVVSLNLQGYIASPTSMLRMDFFFQYSTRGAIFHAESSLRYVPVIAHAVCIAIFNALYRMVAMWLTELENHRTMQAHQSSFVLKRVFFECLHCYLPLFYIAFYEHNPHNLRVQLTSLFMVDEVRRVSTECIVPWLVSRFKSHDMHQSIVSTLISVSMSFILITWMIGKGLAFWCRERGVVSR